MHFDNKALIQVDGSFWIIGVISNSVVCDAYEINKEKIPFKVPLSKHLLDQSKQQKHQKKM